MSAVSMCIVVTRTHAYQMIYREPFLHISEKSSKNAKSMMKCGK